MPGWRDEAQKRVKEKGEGAKIKINNGANCIRALPDKADIDKDGKVGPKGCIHKPYREFRMHYEVGPDKAALGCGIDISGEGECYLCSVKIPELEASNNPAKKELAKKIQAKEVFLMNACRFDPDTQKFSAAKPWTPSTGSGIPGRQGESLAVRIFSRIAAGKKEYIDPNKGHNINITKTGEGLKTRYPEIEGDESPSKVPAEILKAMKSLDASVPVYDEEDMKAAYFGRPKKEDEESAPVDDEETTEETTEETVEETEPEPEVETEESQEETEPAEEEATETETDPEVEEEYEAEPETEIEEEEPAPPPRKVAPKPAPAPAKKPVPASTKPPVKTVPKKK